LKPALAKAVYFLRISATASSGLIKTLYSWGSIPLVLFILVLVSEIESKQLLRALDLGFAGNTQRIGPAVHPYFLRIPRLGDPLLLGCIDHPLQLAEVFLRNRVVAPRFEVVLTDFCHRS